MSLTERERTELNAAVLEYLQDHACGDAATAFQRAIGDGGGFAPAAAGKRGALERRWGTLRTLTRANADLEAQLTDAKRQVEAARDPTKRTVAAAAQLPREPATAVLKGHRDMVSCLAFHPFEPLCYSGSEDGTVRTWDLQTKALVPGSGTLRHAEAVTSVAVEPSEGRWLAVGCNDQAVRLYEGADCVRTLHGHDDAVTAVAWAGDGAGLTLVSASRDGDVRVWDAHRASLIASIPLDTWVRAVAVPCAPALVASGTLTALAGGGGSAAGGQKASGGSGHANATPVVPWVAVACQDESVQVWNWRTKARVKAFGGHSNVVQCVAFANEAAEDTIVASHGTKDQALELSTKRKKAAALAKKAEAGTADADAAGSYDLEDPMFVASGGRDKDILVHSVASGAAVVTFSVHDNWVRGLAFVPGGKHLLSCSDDGTLRVLGLATGRQLARIAAHEHFVTAMATHPTGLEIMATGSADNSVKLWPCSS